MKRQLGDGAAAAPSKQARTAASPSDDSWAACAAWVSANGGSVGGVAVGTDAAGLRGLQAVVELEPERTLLRVPRRCVLTADRAAQSPRLVHIAPHLTEGQLRHSRSDPSVLTPKRSQRRSSSRRPLLTRLSGKPERLTSAS